MRQHGNILFQPLIASPLQLIETKQCHRNPDWLSYTIWCQIKCISIVILKMYHWKLQFGCMDGWSLTNLSLYDWYIVCCWSMMVYQLAPAEKQQGILLIKNIICYLENITSSFWGFWIGGPWVHSSTPVEKWWNRKHSGVWVFIHISHRQN